MPAVEVVAAVARGDRDRLRANPRANRKVSISRVDWSAQCTSSTMRRSGADAREVLEGGVDGLEQLGPVDRLAVADGRVGGESGSSASAGGPQGAPRRALGEPRRSRRRADRTARRTGGRAARSRRSRGSARPGPASPRSRPGRPARPAAGSCRRRRRRPAAPRRPRAQTRRRGSRTAGGSRTHDRREDGWDAVQRARDPSFPAAPTGPHQYRERRPRWARRRPGPQSSRPRLSAMPASPSGCCGRVGSTTGG